MNLDLKGTLNVGCMGCLTVKLQVQLTRCDAIFGFERFLDQGCLIYMKQSLIVWPKRSLWAISIQYLWHIKKQKQKWFFKDR